MKYLVFMMVLIGAASSFLLAQDKRTGDLISESRQAALDEIRAAKRSAKSSLTGELTQPSDFNELDSFGKGVNFYGSLYAGTLYIAPSCSAPDVPPLAPDDVCVVKVLNQILPATTYSNPAWEITIPGKSAKNVFYLMLNNTVQADNGFSAGNALGGPAFFSYRPMVTIVSDALNDPAAINPDTGLPMGGSFTTGLPGAKFRARTFTAGQFDQEIDSYASVNGLGISRQYWRLIGLPENVIEKFYKKDVTLKFGIRVAQNGAMASAIYSYTFRVLGQ